ncbi:MAG: hypothetical protein ACR2FF_08655 [Mycobacteriales bacterium]|nr:MAG: hypothetical protein DLM56_11640 [Pseudonocardiales bacterium]
MSALATRARAFAAFWWDFVVGDDWRIAVGVVIAIAATALLAHTGVPAWFVLPVIVVAVLAWSVRRAARRAVDQ